MKKIIVMLAVTFCTSCTGMLWDRSSYTENINSLYIEEESSSFVVLGEFYHYVFMAGDDFLSILKASKNAKMTPIFFKFEVTKENTISGEIELYALKSELTLDNIMLLKRLGFDDSKSYNNESLKYNTFIKGVRYAIDSEVDFGKNLSKTYKVIILEPPTDSAGAKAGRLALTPVTVIADLVLVIPLGILYGVFQVFN